MMIIRGIFPVIDKKKFNTISIWNSVHENGKLCFLIIFTEHCYPKEKKIVLSSQKCTSMYPWKVVMYSGL